VFEVNFEPEFATADQGVVRYKARGGTWWFVNTASATVSKDPRVVFGSLLAECLVVFPNPWLVDSTVGAKMKPKAREHSLTSWFSYERTSEAAKFRINGAVDFLARTGADFDQLPNWFRPIDIDDDHFFRFMIRAVQVDGRPVLEARLASSKQEPLFIQKEPGFSTQVFTSHGSHADVLRRGERYHIAVTFRTDVKTGWITMALWIAEGDPEVMETTPDSVPYGSVTFKVRDRADPHDFEDALDYGCSFEFPFGVCLASSAFQTQTFDSLRIWALAPDKIPAPE
jgi:hypothetical protein